MSNNDFDVVIVGAGVTGCSVAVALGRQGRKVVLLERSLKEPNRIAGELLQPGGIAALEQLGISWCLEGIDAVPVRGYEVFFCGDRAHVAYAHPNVATGIPEVDNSHAQRPHTAAPEGKAFHHGRFVQKLREAARRTQDVTLVETTAKELIVCCNTKQVLGVEVSAGEKSTNYYAPLTIIADGYASKFRKFYMNHAPVTTSRFWALTLLDADLPLPGYGHVIVGNGAPILLYQFSKHETRILVDVPEQTMATVAARTGGVKAHIQQHVRSNIPKSILPMFEEALAREGLRSMPNMWLPPVANKTPGMIYVGDAHNMRHPLTGGGMTVAINDAILLSKLLSPAQVPNLRDTAQVIVQMRKFHWQRKKLDSIINIMAQVLYATFAAEDSQMKALQIGTFRYFQLGGNCVNVPVGMLAGIIQRPILLVYHGVAVALLSMWLMIRESEVWRLPFVFVQSMVVFATGTKLLLRYILVEFQS